MQYNKTKDGKFDGLKQKNIDFGGGLERTLAVLNGLEDDYKTEIFLPIIKEMEKLSRKKYGKNEEETRAMRIIADHIKASVFIIADGVVSGNKEHGYILKRLIRRAVNYGRSLGMKDFTKKIAEPIFEIYKDYSHLVKKKTKLWENWKKRRVDSTRLLKRDLQFLIR